MGRFEAAAERRKQQLANQAEAKADQAQPQDLEAMGAGGGKFARGLEARNQVLTAKPVKPAKGTKAKSGHQLPSGAEEAAALAQETAGLVGLDAEIAQAKTNMSGKSADAKLRLKQQYLKEFAAHLQAFEDGETLSDFTVSHLVLWTYDVGEVDYFLYLSRLAEARGLSQVALANKDWKLARLWLIHDWAALQRDARKEFTGSVRDVLSEIGDDWDLPQKLREQYGYFGFYALVREGELQRAHDFGVKAMERGTPIKTAMEDLAKVLAGESEKAWDDQAWKFAKKA